jgi:ABC-2 type transport system permease protein
VNPVNKIFLKLVLLPAAIYKSLGVNIEQLNSILVTKLIMDDRRPNTIQQTSNRNKGKQVSLATLGTMLMSGLIGLVYLFAFSIGSNMVTSLTIYFSMFFFMLSATLISDFTSVLIDVRDTFIILPKPVNDRTLLISRLLHILIHVSKIVLPMSLAGIVYLVMNVNIAAALSFILMVLFTTIFAILFINAVYIGILKVTTPQKFQSVISYIQIVFAIVIYASYQVFPRMINRFGLGSLDLSLQKGILFYPLYWIACTWKFLYSFHVSSRESIGTVLGLCLPFISIYLVVKYLAPFFNNKLALLSSGSGTFAITRPVNSSKHRFDYPLLLSKLFTNSPSEKMGFLFSWKMTSRSRDFKLKVYPSIGYLAVYVVIMFMNTKSMDLQELREESIKSRILVISALYFTSFILTMAISQIVYSEKYKASWMYYIPPVDKPGAIILGGAKAAILKFYIPIVFFITVAGLVLIGPGVLPNILLGLFNELLIATLLVYVGNKLFPFSMHQNTNIKSGSLLRNLFVLAVSGVIALFHFFIYTIMPVVIIGAVLSILATWLIMQSIRNIQWKAVKSSYSED